MLFKLTDGKAVSTVLSQPVHETATHRCDDIRGCVMQFWPPDDEHMRSKHVEAGNKTYCETNFVHQVGQILRCMISKTPKYCNELRNANINIYLFWYCIKHHAFKM